MLANLTRSESPDGEPILENIFIDVSDRKSLEQQLWQAQKLDALGSLAGGVAHDFNNLLTAIMGYADILRDDLGASSPHADDLNEIIKASDRASALTRQLLAFSRRQHGNDFARGGRGAFLPKPFTIRQLTERVREVLDS